MVVGSEGPITGLGNLQAKPWLAAGDMGGEERVGDVSSGQGEEGQLI